MSVAIAQFADLDLVSLLLFALPLVVPIVAVVFLLRAVHRRNLRRKETLEPLGFPVLETDHSPRKEHE